MGFWFSQLGFCYALRGSSLRCEGLTLKPWIKHSSNVFLILCWAFATSFVVVAGYMWRESYRMTELRLGPSLCRALELFLLRFALGCLTTASRTKIDSPRFARNRQIDTRTFIIVTQSLVFTVTRYYEHGALDTSGTRRKPARSMCSRRHSVPIGQAKSRQASQKFNSISRSRFNSRSPFQRFRRKASSKYSTSRKDGILDKRKCTPKSEVEATVCGMS